VRGHQNIFKRLLIHVGAFNLSLIFRSLLGSGTPHDPRNRQSSLLLVLFLLLRHSSARKSRTNLSFSWSHLRRRRMNAISDANSVAQKNAVLPRTVNGSNVDL
jgi:hypothetical protein